MFNRRIIALALAGAVLAIPAGVQAHRQWMIASSTVVSGTDNWVTVDAAASNDIFFIDHRPLSAKPVVTAPDGSTIDIANHSVGQMRSTFDVHLQQQGTYRIALVTQGVMGRYTLNGKTEMLPRYTTKANLAERIPAGATNVETAENVSRNEIYVTQGAPDTKVFAPAGAGIELVPVTHPNDLVSGEAATFQFLMDGKPGANLFVTAIPGGIRYRDKLNEMHLRTDAQGKVTITWPQPGYYWLNVTEERPADEDGPGAGGPRPAGPPKRRVAYVTTLEVLAP
jgi:hypothetical protein